MPCQKITSPMPHHGEDTTLAGRFIVSEQKNLQFSRKISIHSCCFSTTDYSDNLYEHLRIFFPSTVKNSVTKRRAEFLAGRYCAQKSLLRYDDSFFDVHIGKHRQPQWPAHIAGSISHTNNHAIAATALKSDIRGIGIDIQEEIDTYHKIQKQVLFGDELLIIEKSSHANQKRLLFTLAFSVKESFFKAAFNEAGRYFDFSSVAITQVDSKTQTIMIKINEKLSERLKPGIEIKAEYRILPERKIITLVKLDGDTN